MSSCGKGAFRCLTSCTRRLQWGGSRPPLEDELRDGSHEARARSVRGSRRPWVSSTRWSGKLGPRPCWACAPGPFRSSSNKERPSAPTWRWPPALERTSVLTVGSGDSARSGCKKAVGPRLSRGSWLNGCQVRARTKRGVCLVPLRPVSTVKTKTVGMGTTAGSCIPSKRLHALRDHHRSTGCGQLLGNRRL